jgi:hypothetical protein
MFELTGWHRPTWLAISLLIAPGAAISADTAAGMVKYTAGAVSIERTGLALPVQIGTLVMPQDKILTGPDGVVGLTLADDTRLSAGPNSALSLKQFTFDSRTFEGIFSLQILKGTLRAITGVIGRRSPSSVKYSTNTVTLGIRGTDFIVEVPANEE